MPLFFLQAATILVLVIIVLCMVFSIFASLDSTIPRYLFAFCAGSICNLIIKDHCRNAKVDQKPDFLQADFSHFGDFSVDLTGIDGGKPKCPKPPQSPLLVVEFDDPEGIYPGLHHGLPLSVLENDFTSTRGEIKGMQEIHEIVDEEDLASDADLKVNQSSVSKADEELDEDFEEDLEDDFDKAFDELCEKIEDHKDEVFEEVEDAEEEIFEKVEGVEAKDSQTSPDSKQPKRRPSRCSSSRTSSLPPRQRTSRKRFTSYFELPPSNPGSPATQDGYNPWVLPPYFPNGDDPIFYNTYPTFIRNAFLVSVYGMWMLKDDRGLHLFQWQAREQVWYCGDDEIGLSLDREVLKFRIHFGKMGDEGMNGQANWDTSDDSGPFWDTVYEKIFGVPPAKQSQQAQQTQAPQAPQAPSPPQSPRPPQSPQPQGNGKGKEKMVFDESGFDRQETKPAFEPSSSARYCGAFDDLEEFPEETALDEPNKDMYKAIFDSLDDQDEYQGYEGEPSSSKPKTQDVFQDDLDQAIYESMKEKYRDQNQAGESSSSRPQFTFNAPPPAEGEAGPSNYRAAANETQAFTPKAFDGTSHQHQAFEFTSSAPPGQENPFAPARPKAVPRRRRPENPLRARRGTSDTANVGTFATAANEGFLGSPFSPRGSPGFEANTKFRNSWRVQKP